MALKIIIVIAATCVLGRAAVPKVHGFSLTWADDFDGGVDCLPSSENWIIDTGTSYPGGPANWGTQEIQTYTDSPANLNLTGDGSLRITPLRHGNNSWTSARIETQRTDFQAKAGGKMRISARIQMPDITGEAAAGYWPAFWTLGDTYRGNYQNWPMIGEYDIMENVNGINKVWGVLHCGIAPGGPCKEFTGLPATQKCPGSPCQGNYHIYTIEVDRSCKPEKLSWSVDDVCYHTVTENQLGKRTWEQAVHHGHFLLLNVAMGGAFPNGDRNSTTPIAATKSGIPMYADWIAVYNSV